MYQKILVLSLSFLCALPALAENTLQNNTLTTTVTQPDPYAPRLVMGWKSYNDSARPTNLQGVPDAKAKNYKGKQEMYLGAKLNNGWGAFGQIVQTRSQYKDATANKWETGDASLTLTHPVLYDAISWRVFGQFRQYFPTSDFSNHNGTYQSAYYLMLAARLNETQDAFNVLTPRYFYQTSYAATDTRFYVEDRTTISQKMNKWSRIGFGQWTQVEAHAGSPTGTAVEVYPYADFIMNKNLSFGPRMSFPVNVQGSVYDGPKKVAMDNAYFEMFLEATL